MYLEPYRPMPHTLSVEIRTTDGRVVSTFVLNPPAGFCLRTEVDPRHLDRPLSGADRTAFAVTLTDAQLVTLRDALRHLAE